MNDTFMVRTDELDFLVRHIREPSLKAVLEQASKVDQSSGRKSNRIALHLDDIQREALVDHLAQLLSELGLEPTSEPNAVGLRIESLIDTFTSTSA